MICPLQRSARLLLALLVLYAASHTPAVGHEATIVRSEGRTIRVIDEGSGQALLFIAGWTMPADVWDPQIHQFSGHYRTVAMSLGGEDAARSGLEGHTLAEIALDINAVIRGLGLQKPVLVGWSMGVRAILEYLSRYGETEILSLVLVEGKAGGDLDSSELSDRLRFLKSFQKDRRQATRAFVRGMCIGPQPESLFAHLEEACLAVPTDTAVAQFISMLTADYSAQLGNIRIPTLLVGGSRDANIALKQAAEKISHSSLLILENAGHAPFLDQPEKFNAALDEHFRLVNASAKQ